MASEAKRGAKALPIARARTAFLLILAASALYFLVHGYRHCSAPPLQNQLGPDRASRVPDGLGFMRDKNVVLVSHELTLTGGPLLLMELAVLLRSADASVQWVTINQREGNGIGVTRHLESKLLQKGVKVLPNRGPETVTAALEADLVVLNTAVAGKWIDSTLKSDYAKVLPKVLWWIHEMRGHYFTLDYVKHMPRVAAVMIDSHATAEYWTNRTQARLGIYVVHLGNSQELTEAAENALARKLLRQHVRESLGISDDDVVFAAINSVSRGKGQDLFLKAFSQALDALASQQKIHAVIVGSDLSGQPKFESELRQFVERKGIQHVVHFVNKTMNVVPYLASADVLVQNSQARGECFGRISIEAMAFKLPVLGTAAGGTTEIVVDGTTGYLHPVGKEGVSALTSSIIKLSRDKQLRISLGVAGYQRVQQRFMEHHMSRRIGDVLRQVLS